MIFAYIVMKVGISNENHYQKDQTGKQVQHNSITNKIVLQQTNLQQRSYLSPYNNFYFALKSKEVKREYPKFQNKLILNLLLICNMILN